MHLSDFFILMSSFEIEYLAPTEEEVRDLNSETRKLPAEPEDKIRKFSKLLGKFHKLYLQDCKKAIRLNEVNERFNVSFFSVMFNLCLTVKSNRREYITLYEPYILSFLSNMTKTF